jgi:hypothetical protein
MQIELNGEKTLGIRNENLGFCESFWSILSQVWVTFVAWWQPRIEKMIT